MKIQFLNHRQSFSNGIKGNYKFNEIAFSNQIIVSCLRPRNGSMDKIIIYTDGSARGNPGPGGFGAILIWGDKVKEIAEAYRYTTNNRMELLAVIKAISILKTKQLPILVYTDSKYVVESVEKKWLDNWIKTDFKGGKKNKDLWLAFYELSKVYKVKFHWVKGHADNPYNNRCDELATMAADTGPWEVDTFYEAIDPKK
jgi:ribonuclease HI